VRDQCLDVCGHSGAQVASFSQDSLALGGLDAELVTAIGVIQFHFAVFGQGKSFCGSFMRFDLCHFIIRFSVTIEF
jgi:hypothetical protein